MGGGALRPGAGRRAARPVGAGRCPVGPGQSGRAVRSRPDMDHVSCDHRPPGPVHLDDQVALGGHVDRRALEVRSRPARSGPACRWWCSGPGGRRPAGPGRAPSRGRTRRGPRASSRASRISDRSTGCPASWLQGGGRSRPGPRGRSSSVAGQFTLIPIPTTIGRRGPGARPDRRDRSQVGLGQDPGQLATVRPQQVVRPLDPQPRGRRPTRRPRRRPGPPRHWPGGGRPAGRSGRSRTDTSRLAPGGASQRRPSRPRPASGSRPRPPPPRERRPGPRRAGTGWSSRSSSKRRMSVNRVPGMAHTLRAVTVLERLGAVAHRRLRARSDSKGAAC